MRIKHFFLEKIAHSSYLLAGPDQGVLIDPQRDVDCYLAAAEALGVKITHVLQTHLHADFVSGHLDLAARCGAEILLPAAAAGGFAHRPVREGERIEIDNMVFRVLETPGHTPEHVCYLLSEASRPDETAAVFTGDTLFVGDVGRPDLFPGRARELAGKLYDSLHGKLLALPDYCEVYPAHGAGSLCGRAMSAKWQSTIGYERLFNPALQIRDRDEFVHSLTNDMPPAPDHFSRCSEINRRGPVLLSELPALREIPLPEFSKSWADKKHLVLDIRSYPAFAALHLPGSRNIDLNGNFPIFAGWLLDPDREIILVADDRRSAGQALLQARRVGIERISGFLEGGISYWAESGLPCSSFKTVPAARLTAEVSRADILVVDVRSPGEFASGRLPGALNLPVPELRNRHGELDPQRPLLLVCSSGFRAGLAASILEEQGFADLSIVAGGMSGYSG